MDKDSKNISIASYITPIGWCVAIITKNLCNTHTNFAIFHLRQGFGLNVLMLVFYLLFKLVNLWVLQQILSVLYVVCAIYGIMGATQGRMLYQPLIGRIFDRGFTFIR